MSFQYPWLAVLAVLVALGLVVAYRWLERRRSTAFAAAGLSLAVQPSAGTRPRRAGLRRHLPPALFLLALTLLLLAVARPQVTAQVPRLSGTVILAFDVSNSMAAEDIEPTRLGAAQQAAIRFVQAQPDTVDIGVVAFGQGALTARLPSDDHAGTVGAIERLAIAGGTSLGQAILASLTAITGQQVSLPDPEADPPVPAPNLGYWGSATIVLLSDGEDTGGPDALAAAAVAATAGVHIETIGVGTAEGAVIEIDGYQVATALNEELLTEVAETTTGSYHQAGDAESLGRIYQSLDLRIATQEELIELTGLLAGTGLLLLTIGGFLMVTWFGRIL